MANITCLLCSNWDMINQNYHVGEVPFGVSVICESDIPLSLAKPKASLDSVAQACQQCIMAIHKEYPGFLSFMYKSPKPLWALCFSSRTELQEKLRNNNFDVESTAIHQQAASHFLVLGSFFFLCIYFSYLHSYL